jgi:ABC-type sugar transport system ATPase subunit
MEPYAKRTNQLSGGQQQRVALAQQLSSNRMSAPGRTLNLDAKLRLEMRDEIRRIDQTKVTTIYVT